MAQKDSGIRGLPLKGNGIFDKDIRELLENYSLT